jgi:hypothetical protein
MEIMVDTSGGLNPEELEYVGRRDHRARESILGLVGLRAAPDGIKVPRIAFVGSGGGFRATTSYISMLAALQRIGLFDCGTYAAGLSGGAWALFSLVLRGVNPCVYGSILRERLCQGTAKEEKKKFILKLLRACFEKGDNRVVGTWGEIVSERLFGDIAHDHYITFDDIRANLHGDNYPYPICPVITEQTNSGPEWVEISPFGIYSMGLGGGIPNQLFGSAFDSGHITSTGPALPFQFYMGMVGSAFCLSFGDLAYDGIQEFLDTIQVDEAMSTIGTDMFSDLMLNLEKIIGEIGLNKKRFFPARIPNYSYNLSTSKIKNLSTLELFDAGISINLPFPTLIRRDRDIDIYIVCDASSDATDRDFTQLRLAAEWAKDSGIKFPTLNKFKILSPDMRIFYEDDISVPYVIYFSNHIDIGTSVLAYTTEEFDRLYGFMHDLVLSGSQAILDVIRKKMLLDNHFDTLPQGVVEPSTCCIIL